MDGKLLLQELDHGGAQPQSHPGMSDHNKEVLDYLRAQFARVDQQFVELRRWTVEADRRFLAIERSIAAVRRDAVLDTEAALDREERQSDLAARIERIERRLNLID
jgi:hypothetical protein